MNCLRSQFDIRSPKISLSQKNYKKFHYHHTNLQCPPTSIPSFNSIKSQVVYTHEAKMTALQPNSKQLYAQFIVCCCHLNFKLCSTEKVLCIAQSRGMPATCSYIYPHFVFYKRKRIKFACYCSTLFSLTYHTRGLWKPRAWTNGRSAHGMTQRVISMFWWDY